MCSFILGKTKDKHVTLVRCLLYIYTLHDGLMLDQSGNKIVLFYRGTYFFEIIVLG